MNTDSQLEELRAQIRKRLVDGDVSAGDRASLALMASRAGVSDTELDLLINQARLGARPQDETGFVPRWRHVLMALMAVLVLAAAVMLSLDGGPADVTPMFRSQSDVPVAPGDMVNVYSGNYDGKAILLNVRSVREEDGVTVLYFDLKCDFVSVATGCRCVVDLAKNTYAFCETDATRRKVPLGTGTIVRTMAGKIVFRPSSGVYELVQL